jgi:hypothetical protein
LETPSSEFRQKILLILIVILILKKIEDEDEHDDEKEWAGQTPAPLRYTLGISGISSILS